MFEVGDLVECISRTGTLETGAVYKVKELYEELGRLFVKVEGSNLYYFSERFKPHLVNLENE